MTFVVFVGEKIKDYLFNSRGNVEGMRVTSTVQVVCPFVYLNAGRSTIIGVTVQETRDYLRPG